MFTHRSKEKYAEAAKAAGVPAIISAGIYPGTSNVMAAHIISLARKEYDEDWNYRQPEQGELRVSLDLWVKLDRWICDTCVPCDISSPNQLNYFCTQTWEGVVNLSRLLTLTATHSRQAHPFLHTFTLTHLHKHTHTQVKV